MKTPLYLMLFKTQHALRHKNRENMVEFNLSPGQPKVLRYLNTHIDCMMCDIASENDIENATMSKILNNLENKGMISRKVNPGNKRAYQVNITEQGRRALSKWNEHCLEIENISLQGFSDKDKEIFKDYLSRMYKNLTNKEMN